MDMSRTAALAWRAGTPGREFRGAETEAELTFSALADLLDPVLGELTALPEPQAAALMGALALGPPAPGDRLAVCVATLGVLRAAAQRRPVLAVVDDLQWVDASSRECIEYAARLAGGRLAVVLAARDPWYPPERVHLPELQVGPVDDVGAAELLRHRAPDLAPPVATAIAQAAAGNPLALVELTAALNTDQRTGAGAPRPGAAAWSTTTSSRPSPPRSRSTTSGRCRSSGLGRCSPSGAGCIAPGGAPRRASVSWRHGSDSSSWVPAPGPSRPRLS
jgi:hypothetical protein